jgi:cytochrome c biogenesis protein CcdA
MYLSSRDGNDRQREIGSRKQLTMDKTPNKLRWIRATVLIIIAVVSAWSWLFLVSKWGPAKRIDILTFKAGVTSKVMRTLLKQGQSTGHHDHDAASISAIYATPEYFTMTEQSQQADRFLPDRFAVFYVFEDIHAGDLSERPPEMMLRLDDGREFPAVDQTVMKDSYHHRATVVRFPGTETSGRPVFSNTSSFELIAHDPTVHAQQTMTWQLPIQYSKDLTSEADLSLPTLFALLAGLMAVLSPCLLQLTVYYTFALTGMSMQQNADGQIARRQVIRTALYFVLGFTIVFTATGSLAGFAGQKLQSTGILENWNRPLAIAAGVGILLLGIWGGVNSGAPGFCRLPLTGTGRAPRQWLDAVKMMFMGSAFAVGCSTCFGGALFISLMIYVGTVGSALLGAVALFIFSVGIAIPYLLAAFFLSRALPLLNSLHKLSVGVGVACSLVLMFFGVILITDNFHIPSNILYRLYLGL